MELVRLDSLAPRGWPEPAVAVGNFDGVHVGHQGLIRAAVAEARKLDSGTAVVLTFDPHPARVLSPGRAPLALMTVEQKAEVLGGLGVDLLAVLPFTAELAHRRAEEFVRDVLGQALGARVVVVGESFRFGHRRAGDVTTLEGLGQELGFRVLAHPAVVLEGAAVSSSRVRESLARGDVVAARRLLGRPFLVDGTVVKGVGRGRTLGIPTANLRLMNETLPGGGVYACRCRGAGATGGGPWDAVVNVGRRPTFGAGETTLEAHLLSFSGDLYGCTLRVEFLERLRDERAFPGPEALVAQIHEDVARARAVLARLS